MSDIFIVIIMRQFVISFILLFSFSILKAQSKDEEAIKIVLKTYQAKLESLDTVNITSLFMPGAKVFEGGKDEGGIRGYLDHHLAPELKAFKSFTFSDYKINVKVNGEYAYTIETYSYTVVLAKDDSQIKSQGVATSVLRKTKNEWKIEMTHGSYRKRK